MQSLKVREKEKDLLNFASHPSVKKVLLPTGIYLYFFTFVIF